MTADKPIPATNHPDLASPQATLRPVLARPQARRRFAPNSILSRIFSPSGPNGPKPAPGLKSNLFLGVCMAGYFTAMAAMGWFGWAARDMPDTTPLWSPKSVPVIAILDRRGKEIYRTGGAEASPVDIDDVPDSLVNALVAIEDKRFWHHNGFDPIGLSRAMLVNAKAGKVVQGGSTITQQLAKNVFLTRRQTLKRKSQEIMLAVWLEHRLTKPEILETYLSRVYFGGGTLGIASGSKRFFNKDVQELTDGEAALLAGILQAPDRLNPVKNRSGSAQRTGKVLREMWRQGYLADADFHTIISAPIEVEPVNIVDLAGSGYFSDFVLEQIDKLIGEPQQNIAVHTTLDLTRQAKAEQAIQDGVNIDRNAQQAALIAMDGTGGIHAMVGGVDYQHSPFNRSFMAKRQPGSAFKPFVYLASLEAGMSPWDIRVDEPVTIPIQVNGRSRDWEPGNFSGKFKGDMDLTTALALSINTVAVKIHEKTGRRKTVETAAKLGLTGFKPYASLALGAQEVSLLDLTNAYVPLANWGNQTSPYAISYIYGANGSTLYQRNREPAFKAIEAQTLGQMNHMMRAVVQSGTGKAARIPGYDIAGKTGTTNDYRDAWFIGYTPDFVTGVWVGNDDNSKMAQVTGGSIPARIWAAFMKDVITDLPKTRLPTAYNPVVRLTPSPPEQGLNAQKN